MNELNILIIDFCPLEEFRITLRYILRHSYKFKIQISELLYRYETIYSNIILEKISQSNANLIFFIVNLSNGERLNEIILFIRETFQNIPIIIITNGYESNDILSLLESGGTDFIIPPLRDINVIPRVMRLFKNIGNVRPLLYKNKKEFKLKQLIGNHPTFLTQINKIPLIANCDANVLIMGETGTGKELYAHAIHYLSSRSDRPFIPINCGAIPTELIENELFGHVRGAYTSAISSQEGVIFEADGGTLLLDEVDCMPLSAQVKLLRFLQEKEFRRLGSAKLHRSDIRIISSTNVNLQKAVQEKRFRQDLFYRLNIISITLPLLKERRQDIPLLSKHFLRKYSCYYNKYITGFTPEALQKLLNYNWPGNVRELENILERAVIFASNKIIQSCDITLPDPDETFDVESFQKAKARVIEQFEKDYIQSLLFANQGNITKAAKAAKKNRRAFWELIRKHRINSKEFNPYNQCICIK